VPVCAAECFGSKVVCRMVCRPKEEQLPKLGVSGWAPHEIWGGMVELKHQVLCVHARCPRAVRKEIKSCWEQSRKHC